MDPRIGKALIFATMLGCLDPVLTVVALLSHRNPFVMPLSQKNQADQVRTARLDAAADADAVPTRPLATAIAVPVYPLGL